MCSPGLIQLGEDFYYVHYSGALVKGGNQTVSEANAQQFGLKGGVYYFGDDCKMVIK